MKEFSIECRELRGITLLVLEGNLRLGVLEHGTGRTLSEAVTAYAATSSHRIALDLRGLSLTPDSSGLGELVAARAALSRSGGRLALVNAPPKLRSLVGLMRLDSLFEFFDTESEAVDALAAEPD